MSGEFKPPPHGRIQCVPANSPHIPQGFPAYSGLMPAVRDKFHYRAQLTHDSNEIIDIKGFDDLKDAPCPAISVSEICTRN